jgi:hypothetical protein
MQRRSIAFPLPKKTQKPPYPTWVLEVSFCFLLIGFSWGKKQAPTMLGSRAYSAVLYVVYTVRHEETIRLISARKANADERKQYREANS